jgi:hypothetical protein
MRWIAVFLLGLGLWLVGDSGPAEREVSYKVELIRATNLRELAPPDRQAVSPELAAILRGPLKWRHYWKLCERVVAIEPGRAKRIPLINSREVVIDLRGYHVRKVTAFERGRCVDTSTIPAGSGYSLIGGPREGDSGWFVIVQRDPMSI